MSAMDQSATDQSPVDVDADFIASAMHKLSIDSSCLVDVLTDCNIYLNKLNRADLVNTAKIVDLNLVFDCLNTNDQIQIEQSCSVIKKMLSITPPNIVFDVYSASIERAIRHPDDIVKSTILSQLKKVLTVDNTVHVQVDLICSIIDCLTSGDLSVPYNAVKCLQQFQSIKILSFLPVTSKLLCVLEMSAELRTRLYDVLFHWAKSVDALALISSKGLFSKLVKDITSSDVTIQIVVIQMLIPLCTTEFGFDYLDSLGIISGLYSLMSSYPNELSDDSLSDLLNPTLVEFFINIALVRPYLVLTRYPKVFVVMYGTLKEPDSLTGVSMKSIGVLASSWDCKIALDIPTSILICDSQDDKQLDIWSLFIMELSNIVCSNKTDFKGRAIKAITKIIQIENGDSSSKSDMMARTHKWYKQMQNNPLKNIVYTSCTLPFQEIKRAGFEMLLTLAEQSWGQEEINKCPALMDIVLENCPRDLMVIKDLKKKIIKTLLESDTSKGILNENLMFRLQNNDIIQLNKNSSQPDVSVEEMII